MEKLFDGKKTAKLGTATNPAVVNVQTEKRVKELESVFDENGWNYKIELEPDKPENIEALEILLNPVKTKISFDEKITISVETQQLTHLRANLLTF